MLTIEDTQKILQETFGGECRFRVWNPSNEDWTEEVARPPAAIPDAPPSTIPPDERLIRIREDLGACERCILCRERKNIVFGEGNPSADIVIIGEAPGAEEDEQGKPFVGASGKKLEAMLENVLGLNRQQVYILNVVKCRPPNNRNPNEHELESCLPFLHRQIQSISPRLILLLGTVALKSLFGTSQGITRNRGKWLSYHGIPVMPTFHPAYLLHQRRAGSENSSRNLDYRRNTRLVWQDLVLLRDRMDELGIERAPVTSRP